MRTTMKALLFYILSICLLINIMISPSIANDQQNSAMQELSREESNKKMGCLKVSRRFSLCGNTNFKNRFVGGFGVRFSIVDASSGQFITMGSTHDIGESDKDCDKLMNEEAVPLKSRKNAVKVCREMFTEHHAQRLNHH